MTALIAALLHWVVYLEVAEGAARAIRHAPACLATALTLGVALLDHFIVAVWRSGMMEPLVFLGAAWLLFVSYIVWLAAIGQFLGIQIFLQKIANRDRDAFAFMVQLIAAKPLPLVILFANDLASRH